MSKEKLKKNIEELVQKISEWEEDKKKLVEDLRAKWKHADDEPEELKYLKTRDELVEKIEALRLNYFEIGQAGFDMEISQLKVLILS